VDHTASDVSVEKIQHPVTRFADAFILRPAVEESSVREVKAASRMVQTAGNPVAHHALQTSPMLQVGLPRSRNRNHSQLLSDH